MELRPDGGEMFGNVLKLAKNLFCTKGGSHFWLTSCRMQMRTHAVAAETRVLAALCYLAENTAVKIFINKTSCFNRNCCLAFNIWNMLHIACGYIAETFFIDTIKQRWSERGVGQWKRRFQQLDDLDMKPTHKNWCHFLYFNSKCTKTVISLFWWAAPLLDESTQVFLAWR